MPVARNAGISSSAATPVGMMWYLGEMFSASAFSRIVGWRLLHGSAPYRAVMAGEVSSGICVPVPGPMSRTIPEAVRRIGGIRAEEPTSSGISLLFGSDDIWRGAVVVWLGFVFLFVSFYIIHRELFLFPRCIAEIAKSRGSALGLLMINVVVGTYR